MLYDPKWEKTIPQTDAAVYSAAADAIERRGHAKGLMINDLGGMCLFGAISFVLNGDAMRSSARAFELTLALEPLCGEHPVCWNNADERTGGEVVSLLRRAASEGVTP